MLESIAFNQKRIDVYYTLHIRTFRDHLTRNVKRKLAHTHHNSCSQGQAIAYELSISRRIHYYSQKIRYHYFNFIDLSVFRLLSPSDNVISHAICRHHGPNISAFHMCFNVYIVEPMEPSAEMPILQ